MKKELEFKDILKEARENKNFNQGELSSILGFSRQTISNYEQGLSEPNLKTLVQIADIFDVSLDYLLGRTRQEKNPYLIKTYEEIDIRDQIFTLLKDKEREELKIIFSLIGLMDKYKEE